MNCVPTLRGGNEFSLEMIKSQLYTMDRPGRRPGNYLAVLSRGPMTSPRHQDWGLLPASESASKFVFWLGTLSIFRLFSQTYKADMARFLSQLLATAMVAGALAKPLVTDVREHNPTAVPVTKIHMVL